jgi:uncharacterized membrane protein YgdD (TMEM256/DUF423 family)
VSRRFIALGAFTALLGVAIGAFGAHGLRESIGPERMAWYQTGVQYHMYHALGLLGIGAVAAQVRRARALRLAGGFLVAGILLFSGSLYALAITNAHWLGAITPLGGLAFLLGWIALIWACVGRANFEVRDSSQD